MHVRRPSRTSPTLDTSLARRPFLVLADLLHELGVREHLELGGGAPWLCERLRVIESELDLHVPEVASRETLSNSHRL
jgi:hypothetical protein